MPTRRIIVNATFSATSYTFAVSGTLGGRWNVFPSAVGFFSIGTEPGAPGGGVTAISNAFASWNGDPNSNVNYTYSGADTSGTWRIGGFADKGFCTPGPCCHVGRAATGSFPPPPPE